MLRIALLSTIVLLGSAPMAVRADNPPGILEQLAKPGRDVRPGSGHIVEPDDAYLRQLLELSLAGEREKAEALHQWLIKERGWKPRIPQWVQDQQQQSQQPPARSLFKELPPEGAR